MQNDGIRVGSVDGFDGCFFAREPLTVTDGDGLTSLHPATTWGAAGTTKRLNDARRRCYTADVRAKARAIHAQADHHLPLLLAHMPVLRLDDALDGNSKHIREGRNRLHRMGWGAFALADGPASVFALPGFSSFLYGSNWLR